MKNDIRINIGDRIEADIYYHMFKSSGGLNFRQHDSGGGRSAVELIEEKNSLFEWMGSQIEQTITDSLNGSRQNNNE